MAAEVKKEIQLEIAHVLFIDIVGYSKLSINDQRAAIDELNQAVRTSEQFQNAEAAARLIKIPTGDGMALVFYKSPEEPVKCALEISRALKEYPRLQLRMGVHSGPVSGVIDVNGQANLAGAGLNMAQRVMDCGDAGHTLLSKRVADDLGEYEHWRPLLHDLGECEVKHGVRVSIVNLHTDEVGNAQLPKKFRALKKHRARMHWAAATGALLALAAIVAGIAMFSRNRVPSTLSAPEKSIAVLPFENLSRDPDNAYFAEGIQDEILTRLSKIADLKVISRTSTQHYKSAPENLPEIAKQLGVANILEGSVQKAADEVRVNLQLINATTDAHLWAETYDRKLNDIFAVESDIATSVAETLQAKLTGAEKRAISLRPTENAEAHLLYLQGRYHAQKLSKEELDKGLEFFNRAIALDPGYALAYDGIAFCYFVAIDWLVRAAEVGPNWLEAARKAVELDGTLAEAHTELANAQFWYGRDWAAAEGEFKRAIQLDPRYAPAHEYYGWYLVSIGRIDEGLAEGRRALEIDPLSVESSSVLAWSLWLARGYDEAIEQVRKTLDLDPNYWWAHSILGRCYLGKGMRSEAIAEFQKARSLESTIVEPLAGLGVAYALEGNNAEAMKLLNELQERAKRSYVSPYFIAIVSRALGEKDQAFAWLNKAYDDRSWYLMELKVSPEVDSVRSDPRFQTLYKKMNFPP